MGKKTDEQIKQAQTDKIMNIVAERAGYFRKHPDKYVEEVLGIRLKLFQKILLVAFNYYNFSTYLAARGQGKTWLTALFCVVRAILYPGSKIAVNTCRL